MPFSPKRLTRALEQVGRPVGFQELLRLAGVAPGEHAQAEQSLRELVRTGTLHKEGKRFAFPKSSARPSGERESAVRPASTRPTVEGTLHVNRGGFGFVERTDSEGEDIYLGPREVQRALDNDRVRVEVVAAKGRTQGRLVGVVERRRSHVVGTYLERKGRAEVVPNDASLPGPIRVPASQMARSGDVVKVRLELGDALLTPERGLRGEVAGSLGKPGDSSAEVLSIAFAEGFADEFAPEVMAEAGQVGLAVSEADARSEGRRDLRGLSLVTIDGEDARDFDDAVYAERAPEGYRLVVAIADVSHYVREGTALDREALARATSVYLPDRVLPMLPERISNEICSLKPDEDRLCMVVDLAVDRSGRARRQLLYPAVMRSRARCTYGEVQAVLDGQAVAHLAPIKAQLELLMELARVLNRMRVERGAIDFDLPELKVVLGPDGLPVRMEKRERRDAHRLIEECMLAANEAVAGAFQRLKLPSIYRFHGEPDPEKLAAFGELARAHGFRVPTGGISSRELASFVRELSGHPEQRVLNQLLLRSMMQAVYSAKEVGHYGLAAEQYLHFTSPIRRYPDLMVHRLLKQHWAQRGESRALRALDDETRHLERVALQSSERERSAMQVEREVVSFYAALLMRDRIGETFSATVSSVTDFGFFVELDQEGVEGLVKAQALGTPSRLDKALQALVYPGTGRKVRVGQKLTVRLVGANVQRRQIDFVPVGFAGEAPLPIGPKSEEGSPARRSPGRNGSPRPERRGGKRKGSGAAGGGRGRRKSHR